MNITKTLSVTNKEEWRKWLEKHYKTESEIWLIYYKKDSGRERISYNDAVEEALCFGWIDSTVKGIDKEKYAQRFSPRKQKSLYSQSNRERLKRLIKEGKVIQDVVDIRGALLYKQNAIPKDILNALQENTDAWRNFQKFPDGYKRIRIAYIDGARGRPKEFKKRLNYFITMTVKNKQFGFGGIEKYY